MNRRYQINLNKPSELAIRKAIEEVEKMGANTKLTDIVLDLNVTLNNLADYIDSQEKEKVKILSLIDGRLNCIDKEYTAIILNSKTVKVMTDELSDMLTKIPIIYFIVKDPLYKKAFLYYKGLKVITSEDLEDNEIMVL